MGTLVQYSEIQGQEEIVTDSMSTIGSSTLPLVLCLEITGPSLFSGNL